MERHVKDGALRGRPYEANDGLADRMRNQA